MPYHIFYIVELLMEKHLSVKIYQCQFRQSFYIICFNDFFSQQVRVGGRNKNDNKIHLDNFPIEFKSKETRIRNGQNELYNYFTNLNGNIS